MQLHTGSLLLYTLYAITFSKVKNVANSMEINRKEHSQGSDMLVATLLVFQLCKIYFACALLSHINGIWRM